VPSGWICENVLLIFLTEAKALNILKPEITRYDLMVKTLYDKAKQGYPRRLQELVFSTLIVKKIPMNRDETQLSQHTLAQGWALNSRKSRSSST